MSLSTKGTLDLYIDAELIRKTEQYALENNTSVSQLVEEFFQRIADLRRKKRPHSPLVQQLTGILPPEASINDYYDYLMEKYGGE